MTDINKIILGTGNYRDVKSGNTVSITGDGGNAWGYFGPAYKKLSPRKQIEDEYIKSYYELRLKDLDVKELLYTLNEKFGNDIILLCHEPVDEFCHRRLVADYVELETGICIPEVAVDENGNVKKLVPISYKDRLKEVIK